MLSFTSFGRYNPTDDRKSLESFPTEPGPEASAERESVGCAWRRDGPRADFQDRETSRPSRVQSLAGSRRREPLSSEQGQAVNWDDTIIDAAATDTGMRRANNQDSHTSVRASHAAAWRQRGHVFMVADGMGAHAVGELASKMACDLIPHTYLKTRAGTPSEAITKAFREVSALIYSRASANRDFQGMGTTCSALMLLPEGALISHVGDSRVYRVRRNRIDQFSFDHSLVWELVRRNHLTSEQASSERAQERHHPKPGAGGRHRGRHRGAAGRRARRRISALLGRSFRTGRRPRNRGVRRQTFIPATPAAT